jgi:XTP/dITP diphosphohydrolase
MIALWLATGNRGKVIEFKTLLSHLEIHAQSELPVFSSPPETGKTFEENARIKARALKAVKTGVWVIGEDSGLEVEGLNNMPGIHSARYAGPKAQDAENIAKLLKMMSLRSAQNRKAHFVCCIVAYSPDGKEYIFHGRMNGNISTKVTGVDGFGYDSVFIPESTLLDSAQQTQTLAQLGVTLKNKISHRAEAIRKLVEVIV